MPAAPRLTSSLATGRPQRTTAPGIGEQRGGGAAAECEREGRERERSTAAEHGQARTASYARGLGGDRAVLRRCAAVARHDRRACVASATRAAPTVAVAALCEA